jgi:hypothetical protein
MHEVEKKMIIMNMKEDVGDDVKDEEEVQVEI